MSFAVCLAIAWWGLSFSASAQVNSWTNSFDGKWEDASNWLVGTPSVSDGSDFITNVLTKTVTIDAVTTNTPSAMTISNLTISAPGGSTNTLLLDNAGSLTPLTVLNNLTISSGGAVMLSNSKLVLNNHAVGGFTVDGALTLDNGSSLVVTGRIEVGRADRGNLTLNSGTVTAQVGLFAGESSGVTGTVWVSGGQMAINGANGSVFGESGGVGLVTVSNGTLQVLDLFLGRSAGLQSSLTVAGGTVALGGFSVVGYDANAGGAVWVTGGQLVLTNNTDTTIGDHGIGQMTVSNGAVLGATLYVGRFGSSQGALTILGGDMSVSSSLTVGSGSCSSTAIVLLAGGKLTITNATHNATLTIQSGGTFTENGGTLTVDNLVVNSACARFIHSGGTLIIKGTVTADPSFDADGDGIPNGYEDAYGLDKFNPADAAQDADGDGMSNLQEFLAGTDPTNPASSFRITSVAKTGNDVLVTWMMGPGKTNALQWTVGAGNGSYVSNGFTDLFIVTNAVGTTTNYLDGGGATNQPARFYRVRLLP